MKQNAKIYIAGHTGLVGSAIQEQLRQKGYRNVITRTRQQLDLLDQVSVNNFFKKEQPEYVFLAAAKVGGVSENYRLPAAFLYENIQIQNNVINAAYCYGVHRLLFLSSAVIYPYNAAQPIKEESVLSGPLGNSKQEYALAKIAGTELCAAYNRQYDTQFIVAVPNNIYGPGDNFDPTTAHVIPSFIHKLHTAKMSVQSSVLMWGSGNVRREFLHVSDLANAVIFLMSNYDGGHIVNIGSGTDIAISELAELIKTTIGFEGEVEWDTMKPDGVSQRLLDSSHIHDLGWRAEVPLTKGIRDTYKWYLYNQSK